ncbi:tetratricopeptide repeat protein [Streptomyces sp. URMC 129]|uniref:tetratricopeptide repeat protein n=1 Tax=Streptomyces sp. URMC 129 TaxID=3423407 RepID=UPI003F1A6D43
MTRPPAPPSTEIAADQGSVALHSNYGTVHVGNATTAPVILPPPAQVAPPAGLHNLAPLAPGAVLGRHHETVRLERTLTSPPTGGRQVITQAVTGLGGVGKSTLALHYAHTHRERFTTVWWLEAETPETVAASLAALAARLTPTLDTTTLPAVTLANWALAWLESHPGWLLILDNATDPDHLGPCLPRLRGGTALITTRRTHGWQHLSPHPLHLGVLTPGAATRLLQRDSGHPGSRHRPAAQELAAELGHLPLALEHAAAHIRRTRTTPADYLARFRAQPGRLLETPGHGDPHGDTVARTWRITLDSLAAHTPQAVDLLRVMAWYAPHEIPRALLAHATDDPDRIDDALALLADSSMITLAPDTVAVHRLVQTVARTPAPDGEDPHRGTDAIHRARGAADQALLQALPEDPQANVRGWPTWRALLPHIDALITHTRPDQDTDTTLSVVSRAVLFLLSQGHLPQGTAYAHRALATATRLHGESHPSALTSRNNLASAYRAAGDLGRAVPLFERTLSDRERLLGEDHPSTLTSRNNLAEAYRATGDPGRAVPLYEQTLSASVRVLGEDHPSTLISRNNLARAYHALGDPGRAVSQYEQTLSASVRVLGEDHPSTLTSRNNLARAYQDLGDPGRAVPLFERTLSDRERVLGEDHPSTLLSCNNLAEAYRATGDPGRAIPLYERALRGCDRVLGSDHPSTKTVRRNLAAARARMAAGCDTRA